MPRQMSHVQMSNFVCLKLTTGRKPHAGWSFFRHNLTEERIEDLPPGKGAAAAILLTANASRAANATWTRRVRDAERGWFLAYWVQ